MSNNTITLQSTLNFASTHADLLPLAGVGGYTDEPGLSLCNDALSDLISDPNDWKFNRVEMPMIVTCPNKLDQLFAGASIFTLNYTGTSSQAGWFSQGWGIQLASANGITVAGGVVTVNTLEQHRIPVGALIYMIGVTATTGTAANYNSVFTDNGTNSSWSVGWTVTAVGPTSISFAAVSGQNNGDVLGAPGITNFGYATSACFQEMNNTSSPPNINPGTTYRELPYVSLISNPEKVAVMADLGTGVLKIRYNRVPGSATWGAKIVYQAKAPLKVALTDNWAPFPDNYSAVYRQALLYRMYRYLNDSKADTEFKKLQAEIAKVHGTDQTETTDVSLQPESLMDNGGGFGNYGYW
jgi:hypothetical protein